MKHAEVEPLLRKLLAAQKRILGDEHPDTLGTAGNLANTLNTLGQQGKLAEAEGDRGGALRRHGTHCALGGVGMRGRSQKSSLRARMPPHSPGLPSQGMGTRFIKKNPQKKRS